MYLCSQIPKQASGPAGIPFLGSALSIPKKESWRWFEIVAKKYGRLTRIRLLGNQYLLLSDPRDAEELVRLLDARVGLDVRGRRSLNYSSRPFYPYAGKYRSANKRMLLLVHGEEFKRQRSAMKLLFLGSRTEINRQRQTQQCDQLIMELSENSADYLHCLKRFSSGIALGITFGMNIHEAAEELPRVLTNNDSFGSDLAPGARMVDIFPWLDNLPDVLSPWRVIARQKHQEELNVIYPLSFGDIVIDKLQLFTRWAEFGRRSNCSSRSFIQELDSQRERLQLDEKAILYIGGSIIEAGTTTSNEFVRTNTTSCLLHCFLLACAANPRIVERAHAEFETTLGNRAPTWEDFSSLPYLFAIVKELLRWCPVTPLAFPHLTELDDNYGGQEISGGTLVIASIWNMHRNPTIFDNPSSYNPDRYFSPTRDSKPLEDSSLCEGIWTFGFGRRACPGRQLALDSIWLAIGRILWAFDIQLSSGAYLPDNLDDLLTWRDNVNMFLRLSLASPASSPFH
ncbi:cytochrome P450 [Hysterangium stoloniferum]|nr:cytochrome P450 [Hysterangium stoloniferum]